MVNSTDCHEKDSGKYSFSCNVLLLSGRTVKIPQYVLQTPAKSGKLHQTDLAFFSWKHFTFSIWKALHLRRVCMCAMNMKQNVGFTPMEKMYLKLIKWIFPILKNFFFNLYVSFIKVPSHLTKKSPKNVTLMWKL